MAFVTIPPRARNVPYFLLIRRECFPCHPRPALTAASFKGIIDPPLTESSQTIALYPSFLKNIAIGSSGLTTSRKNPERYNLLVLPKQDLFQAGRTIPPM